MSETQGPLQTQLDRLSGLENTKNSKVANLSGLEYEELPLVSMSDLDTFRFEGVTGGLGGTKDGVQYDRTGQPSSDRTDYYDAYEVYPSTPEGLEYHNNDEDGIEKLTRQRTRLAGELGVPVDTITNEDVYQAGAAESLKALALIQAYQKGDEDYIKQVTEWEPDTELTKQWRTTSPSFGKDVKDLGLSLERAHLGRYGVYGRPLSVVRIPGRDKTLAEELGYELSDKRPTPVLDPSAIYEAMQRKKAERMDTFDRLGNAVDAGQRTLFRELVVDPADMVGEALDKVTGGVVGWDLGTEEEKAEFVNKEFGFNPYAPEKDYQEAKVYADRIVEGMYNKDKEVDWGDVYGLLKKGVTTPELFADSITVLGATFAPFLGWGGKAAKANKKILDVQKKLKAGQITKEAAKADVAALKADIKVLDQVQHFAQKNAGLFQVAANDVNDEIDAYTEEYGEGPSVAKVAQMFTTKALLLGMDRWSAVSIMKSPKVLEGAGAAFKALAAKDKTKVLGKAVIGATSLTADMGKEAGQEYLQTIGEEFNVKFNFDDNGDFVSAVTEAGELFTSQEMQEAGVLGAGLGAGGAVQFSAAGSIAQGVQGITGLGKDMAGGLAGKAGNFLKGFKKDKSTDNAATTSEPELMDVNSEGFAAEEATATSTINAYKNIVATTEDPAALKEALSKGVDDFSTPLSQVEHAERVLKSKQANAELSEEESSSLEMLGKVKDALRTSARERAGTQAMSVVSKYADLLGDEALAELVTAENPSDEVRVDTTSFRESLKEDPSKYSFALEEIEAAEASIRSRVDQNELDSESADLPFRVLRSAKRELYRTLMSEDVQPVLGSGDSSEYIMQEFFDSMDRKEDGTIDISEEDKALAQKYAKDKLPPNRFEAILAYFNTPKKGDKPSTNNVGKDATAVYEESMSVGPRSARGYRQRLKTLVNSNTPDKQQVQQAMTDMQAFKSSQIVRKKVFSQKMEDMKALVAQHNIKVAKGENASRLYNDIKKASDFTYPGGSGKDNKAYINVRKDKATGKLEINPLSFAVEKSLEDTISYLSTTEKVLGAKINKALGKKFEFGQDGIVVPSGTLEKVEKSRKGHRSFYKNRKVTKVVAGEAEKDSNSWWRVGGDYYTNNESKVNSGEYTSEDVVAVHAKPAGKQSKNVFSHKVNEELTKAIKAGASLVIDPGLDEKEHLALTKVLVGRYHVTQTKEDGKTVFVPKQFKDKVEKLKEKEKARVEAAANEKNTKQKMLDGIGDVIHHKPVDKDTLASIADTAAATYTKLEGDIDDLGKLEREWEANGTTERPYVYDKDHIETIKDTYNVDNEKAKAVYRAEKEYLSKYSKDFDKLYNELLNSYMKGGEVELDAHVVALLNSNKDYISYAKKDAVTAIHKYVDDLAVGSSRLSGWKEASDKEKREGGNHLAEWFEANPDITPKGVMEELLGTVEDGKKVHGKAAGTVLKYKVRGDLDADGNPTGYKSYYYYDEAKKRFVGPLKDKDLEKDNSTYKNVLYDKEGNLKVRIVQAELDPSEVVKVATPTVLNSMPLDMLKDSDSVTFNEIAFNAVEAVENAIKTPDLVYRGAKDGTPRTSIHDLSDSPASGLVYRVDSNGEVVVDPNVAMAITIAYRNLVKNNLIALSPGIKTAEQLGLMHGQDGDRLTPEAIALLEDKGLLYKTVVSSAGSDVLALLGLTRNKNSKSDAHAYDRLEADLGQFVVSLGLAEGTMVVDNTVQASTYAKVVLNKSVNDDGQGAYVQFLQFAEDISDDALDMLVSQEEEITEVLPNANSWRKEPLFREMSESEVNAKLKGLRNELLGLGVADDTKKAASLLMNTEHLVDLGTIRFVLEDGNRDLIKERMGYLEIPEFGEEKGTAYEKLSYRERSVQQAINDSIERNLENLEWLVGQSSKSEEEISLWFEYFISKNGRFFVDSNTINVQGNKQLDRFVAQPAEHKNEYTLKNEEGTLSFLVDGEDHTAHVHYALAQAFGFATDKVGTKKVYDMSKSLIDHFVKGVKGRATMDASLARIKEARKALLTSGEVKLKDDVTIEIEHLAHALQGFSFLEQVVKTQAGKGTFVSSLTAEFDAVTSGFGLKLLQTPLLGDSNWKWLNKVGFFLKGSDLIDKLNKHQDAEISMNDALDYGEMEDPYQTLGGQVKKPPFKTVLDTHKEIQRNRDLVIGNGNTDKSVWTALAALLPGKVDGVVTKELRKLFKSPFMTFNYASSIKSIRKALKNTIAEEIASDMAAVDLTSAKESPVVDLMAAYLGMKGFSMSDVDAKGYDKKIAELEELQDAIRTGKFSRVGKSKGSYRKGLEETLHAFIDASYGQQVEDIMTAEFGPFIKSQQHINRSFNVLFHVFDIAFQAEIAKARKSGMGVVTPEQERVIYQKLQDKWPMIRGPLSKMENELKAKGYIGIYEKETVAPGGYASGSNPASVKFGKGVGKKAVKGKDDQKSISASALVRQIASAVSAGSVIPIHYIDGASMAQMMLDLKKQGVTGVTTIHDAIMPPLVHLSAGGLAYNKGVVDVSMNYSFVDAIAESMDSMIDNVKDMVSKDDEAKEAFLTRKVQDPDNYKETISLMSYIAGTYKGLVGLAKDTAKARYELFKEVDEKGAYFMHMAGTPDSVYDIEAGSLLRNVEALRLKMKRFDPSKADILSGIDESLEETGKRLKTIRKTTKKLC